MKLYSCQTHPDYLHDESRMSGSADLICLPESEADVIHLLQEQPHQQVTISGARTGLTGGSVPQGGVVLSTERLAQLSLNPEARSLTAGPGVRLRRIQEELSGKGLFFAPDPTEPTCSIGGMIACNASGARTYRYGATRCHVNRLRIVLSDGDVLDLSRGEAFAEKGRFSLQTESGARIEGALPSVPLPTSSKHAAGYRIEPDMDMLDLFIGSEGTLGIVTEAELALLPTAPHRWAGLLYFDAEEQALDFVQRVRTEDHSSGLSTEAIEFFGIDALALLAREQAAGRIHIDDALLPKEPCCAVYTEHTGTDTQTLTAIYRRIGHCASAAGGSPRRSCAAVSAPGLAGLRAFRHAVPESVNMQIADLRKEVPEVTKLAADICVLDDRLSELLALYRGTLAEAGLDSAIFGHIGNSHLHANIIPRTAAEYRRGRAALARWAGAGAAFGGSVSAEHGIGKLKKPLLALQYPREVLAGMFELKRLFDPALRLNPGNLFD